MTKIATFLAEKQTEKWQQQLNNRIPLVGSWLRQEAARLLKQAAGQGNAQAMHTLALAYTSTKDAAVKRLAGEALQSVEKHPCIDAVWMAWIATRSSDLLQILIEKNWVANAPPQARLYSALRLEKLELITKGSPDIIPYLLDACRDPNPDLAEAARSCLTRLEKQESIDALCLLWVEKRTRDLEDAIREGGYIAQNPPLACVYTALINHRPEMITGGGADIVAPLLRACADPDLRLQADAKKLVGKLLNPAAIDALCAVWIEKRADWLGDLIGYANYVAREPARNRLLTSAKCSQTEALNHCAPGEIQILLNAARSDPDVTIREQANQALSNLALSPARDELCQIAAEKEDLLAIEIATRAGYTPSRPESRALFFFMLERWDEYETLDFDQRLMRAIFSTGSSELRSRITRKLQKAGRADFLGVLSSGLRTGAVEIEGSEFDALVSLLETHQKWDQLWDLALETSFAQSIRLVRLLSPKSWRPSTQPACTTFETLLGLVVHIPEQSSQSWLNADPPAAPRARVRVSGRINDVAISPQRPIIALAVGNKKLVLWNFQKAQVEKIVTGFSHSVGKVAYTPQGLLLCSERASKNSDFCGLYTWDDKQLVQLGAHRGSITAFEPLGDSRALSTGKDEIAFLWDLPGRKALSQKDLHFWPRSARIAPDGSEAVLLDRSLAILSLPDLNFIRKVGYTIRSEDGHGGVCRCAAFLPEGNGLVLGKSNGHVLAFHPGENSKLFIEQTPLVEENGEIQGIEVLERHRMIVTAAANGNINYFRWPEKILAGKAKNQGERLTSLSIASDGAIMATGDSDAALGLWDLQILDLPGLIQKPFSQFTSKEMATLHALSLDHSFSPAIQACIQYLLTVVQHRTRYDIQLDDVRSVQSGEFDIMIE